MPARFFGIFLGLIAVVLVIGGLFINMISEETVVEYWILLLLPCFGVPILSAVCLKEID